MTLLSLPMLTVRKGEDTILTYINPDRPLDLETPLSLLVSCPGELRARLAVALFSGPLGSSRATERRHLAQNESWCRTRRFGDSGPLHADQLSPVTFFSFVGEFRASASLHHLHQTTIRSLVDLTKLTQPFDAPPVKSLHIGGCLRSSVN